MSIKQVCCCRNSWALFGLDEIWRSDDSEMDGLPLEYRNNTNSAPVVD